MTDSPTQAPCDSQGAHLVLARFVAGELGWPWKAAVLMRFLPRAIPDFVYDLVAQSRYRVFGRHERCLTPRPEFLSRFVD